MTAPKLTPAQLAVLRLMCHGSDAVLSQLSWYVRGNKVTRQMSGITKYGGLVETYTDSRVLHARATDKARALLAAIDKENADANIPSAS